MADVLGIGVTHYPPLTWPDQHMAGILGFTLADPDLPEEWRDGSAWPEAMRAEYGEDRGATAAAAHRARLVEGFRSARRAIDAFGPDVIVVWGDDQYENFREELVPAFSVLAYDDLEVRPWEKPMLGIPNFWGEPEDTAFCFRGARAIGKQLTAGLLEAGFDMAYSYIPARPEVFPHAFLNTQLFLDYDRVGFDYPMLPIAVNCYGSYVIKRHGGIGPLKDIGSTEDLDPPSPSPRRCMELGEATARFFAGSNLRVALVASSSWSHAFLTDKTWRMHPDIDADRRLYEALRDGDYDVWRAVSLDEIAESGQQEMLNWFCLAGAMSELGRTPSTCEFIETYAFNSNKCFAIFDR